MTFYSILFKKPEDRPKIESLKAPVFFGDLNLDQIIASITAGKQEYNLKQFFFSSLQDVRAIEYRHEIMRDMEDSALFGPINSFAQRMRTMREYLVQAEKLSSQYQKESWFLDAVEMYCEAVTSLANDLSRVELKSQGFLAFRKYLAYYISSGGFKSLLAQKEQIKSGVSSIQYCLLIKGSHVTVRKYEGETDYSAAVLHTFDKFKQGAVKDHRIEFSEQPGMNHVEEKILEMVAQLYPDIFTRLDNFYATTRDYVDKVIGLFDREIQFYVAYLEYIATFKRTGLVFCYPKVTNANKQVYDYEGFDLALANKLITEGATIVCNDFYLKDKERILVVTGPNQGGKTTFARTFGQVHFLASLGCPVPGREAKLFLFDGIYTHFEKEESIQNLRGKLQDDLIRIHQILTQATSKSIIILNELFTSTTSQDALFLSEKIMEIIIRKDALGVWVTFIDELASFSEKTVSMMSTIVPQNPALRTYKIIRRPADGLAYAVAVAKKHRLTYDELEERLQS